MRIQPRYQLTVFAPRSVDPTETTPLTPRPGSVHSEPFIVSTHSGDVGSRPYLDWPRGRQASIDPLTKKRTVGRLSFRILDKKTGTDNLARWVTAFLGDARGANQLAGCRVEVKEWDGAAYQPWYAGRIEGDQLQGASWYDLTVDDHSADLDVPVFVGRPHAAVAGYAHQAQLLPLGLLKPYSTFPLTRAVRGTVAQHFTTAENYGFVIEADHGDGDQNRLLVTEQLHALTNRNDYTTRDSTSRLRAEVTPSGGAAHEWARGQVFVFADDLRAKRIYVGPDPDDATAFPAVGTVVDVVIYAADEATSAAIPLHVHDVHPVTYLRHLAAGYYGRMRTDGSPSWPVRIHEASFAALEADASLLPYRTIHAAPSTLNKELERICRERNLAYDLNAAGEIELIDLRRQTGGIAGTLTDDDRVLEAGVPRWAHTKKGALPVARASYYLEQWVPDSDLPRFSSESRPDIPSTRITARKLDAALLYDDGARDRFDKPKEEAVDGTGLRFRGDADELLNGRPRALILEAFAETLVRDLQAPLSRGPAYIDVVCRATSANAAQVRPGQRWILDFDVVPDAATNLRGGPRLGLCVSRAPEGLQVKLRFLDMGESAVAVAPVLAAPGKTVGDGAHSIDVPVTLNAAAAPVRIDVAVTAATVAVRPAETDAAWHRAAIATATGTVRVPTLPASRRIWVRARSEPQSGDTLQIASGWVFPAGAGYVDLDALTAPTALVVVSPTASGTSASWTLGEAEQYVELLLVAGAAPAEWLDAHVLALLDRGAVTLPLGQFVALTTGATYTLGVRHTDRLGGVSAVEAETFVVGVAELLDPPANPAGFAGSVSHYAGSDVVRTLVYGLAVEATEFPSTVEFREEIETAPGSGVYGAPTTVAALPAISGDWTVCELPQVYDGRLRRLSARQVRDGATPSAWTAGIAVTPWATVPLPPFGTSTAAPTARLVEVDNTATKMDLQVGGSSSVVEWRKAEWTDTLEPEPAFAGAWDATPLPATITVNRLGKLAKRVKVEGRDAAGRVSFPAYATVPGRAEALTNDGLLDRGQPTSDGGYTVSSSTPTGKRISNDVEDSRFSLINDTYRLGADTADQILNGSSRRIPSSAAVDTSGNMDFGAASGWLGRHAGNLPRTVGGTAISTIVSRLTNAGDAESTFRDSRLTLLNTHFDTASQTADQVPDGAARRTIASSAVDVQARPILIARTDNTTLSAEQVGGAIGDSPDNMVQNGGAQSSSVGHGISVAGPWVYGTGEAFVASSAAAKFGDRSARCTHLAPAYSSTYQDGPMVYAGQVVELGLWVKPDGFVDGGGVSGALLAIAGHELPGTWTVLGSITDTAPGAGTTYAAAVLDNATADAAGWVYLQVRARCEVEGLLRVYLVHGYGGNVGGGVYIDGVVARKLEATTTVGGARGAKGLTDDGEVAIDLPPTIRQRTSASVVKVLAKGRLTGSCRHGDTVVFPVGFFQSVPMVIIHGGANVEPRSKWGPLGNGAESNAPNAALPQYDDVAALGLSMASFEMRARLRQKAGSTPRSDAFPAGVLMSAGASLARNLDYAPANNDTYTIDITGSITANDPAGSGSIQTDVELVVAIEVDAGAGYLERASRTYLATTRGAAATVPIDDEIALTIAGLDNTDDVRVRAKSFTVIRGSGGSFSIDPGAVSYATSADLYATKTPDSDDRVTWEGIEVSS